MRNGVKLFFAYAQEDKSLRDKLAKHLSPLKRLDLIVDWHDHEICAGTQWESEIDRHLNTSDIILLLISSDFMASDYCYSTEMTRALERHEARQACVIPIILRPVFWQIAPFNKLQVLPAKAKPIICWHHMDQAFTDVALGILKVVEQFFPGSSANTG